MKYIIIIGLLLGLFACNNKSLSEGESRNIRTDLRIDDPKFRLGITDSICLIYLDGGYIGIEDFDDPDLFMVGSNNFGYIAACIRFKTYIDGDSISWDSKSGADLNMSEALYKRIRRGNYRSNRRIRDQGYILSIGDYNNAVAHPPKN